MAIGAIEMSTIARSHDVMKYKTGDDARGLLQQTALVREKEKEVRSNAQKVRSAGESDWHSRKFDAGEEGKGTYSGDGGQKRRRRESGEKKVFCENRENEHFDVQV